MGTLSIWHWLIVLLVVILVFGTKKLKNIGSDLGGAVKGFKDGMKQAEGPASEDGAGAASTTTTAQVGQAPAATDKNTIDVEAKTKL